jgi:hypothetical protein
MLDLPRNFVWLRNWFAKFFDLSHSNGSVIIRCSWKKRCEGNECATCETVVDGKLAVNGITTTPDRQTVFVNELPERKVLVYDRQVFGYFFLHVHPTHALLNFSL